MPALRSCRPDQVEALLPGALAGEFVLAPVPDAATAALLRPAAPVTEPDAAVVVVTSGSTGTPKAVVLAAAAITAAADGFRARHGAFNWACALPTHYVAGLMVLARGLLDRPHGGAGVRHAAPDLHDLTPAAGRNAISLVPTQLVRALRDASLSERLAGFDAVLVGGAALPAGTREAARAAGIKLLTSYGMSETCGGCVFDGEPLPGVTVELDKAGRISIGGPQLFSGYRLDPEATAASLVAGRLLTNDRGEWHDGRLRVLGRLDDVVISGGVNVDLAAAQRVLDELAPGQGVLLAVPDAEWGARIVLASTAPGLDLAAWRARLRPRLAAAALPRQLLTVAALPRTSSGKIDRQQLRDLASTAFDTQAYR